MQKAPGSITERGMWKEKKRKWGKREEGGGRGDGGRDVWRWGKREAEIKYQPSKPDDLHSIPRTHIYRRKLTPQGLSDHHTGVHTCTPYI